MSLCADSFMEALLCFSCRLMGLDVEWALADGIFAMRLVSMRWDDWFRPFRTTQYERKQK